MGSRCATLDSTARLQDAGTLGSIGGIGDALVNDLMESWIGVQKPELVPGTYFWLAEVEHKSEKFVSGRSELICVMWMCCSFLTK